MLEEPWLRGPMQGVDPILAPVLYSFQHAREDLARYTEGLTAEQIWARPHGLGPVGFHLRHIGGSADRLSTYLQGQQLSPEQMAALKAEMQPGASREDLLSDLEAALQRAGERVLAVDIGSLTALRTVGRKHLPVTVLGLLTHIAEHTQRHVGQAITTAKLVRAAMAQK